MKIPVIVKVIDKNTRSSKTRDRRGSLTNGMNTTTSKHRSQTKKDASKL